MAEGIKFSAGENPYLVEHGGFYRRWMPMLSDINELVETVKKINTTTEESWIPIWNEVAKVHEDLGDRAKVAKSDNQFAYKQFAKMNIPKHVENFIDDEEEIGDAGAGDTIKTIQADRGL